MLTVLTGVRTCWHADMLAVAHAREHAQLAWSEVNSMKQSFSKFAKSASEAVKKATDVDTSEVQTNKTTKLLVDAVCCDGMAD